MMEVFLLISLSRASLGCRRRMGKWKTKQRPRATKKPAVERNSHWSTIRFLVVVVVIYFTLWWFCCWFLWNLLRDLLLNKYVFQTRRRRLALSTQQKSSSSPKQKCLAFASHSLDSAGFRKKEREEKTLYFYVQHACLLTTLIPSFSPSLSCTHPQHTHTPHSLPSLVVSPSSLFSTVDRHRQFRPYLVRVCVCIECVGEQQCVVYQHICAQMYLCLCMCVWFDSAILMFVLENNDVNDDCVLCVVCVRINLYLLHLYCTIE